MGRWGAEAGRPGAAGELRGVAAPGPRRQRRRVKMARRGPGTLTAAGAAQKYRSSAISLGPECALPRIDDADHEGFTIKARAVVATCVVAVESMGFVHKFGEAPCRT